MTCSTLLLCRSTSATMWRGISVLLRTFWSPTTRFPFVDGTIADFSTTPWPAVHCSWRGGSCYRIVRYWGLHYGHGRYWGPHYGYDRDDRAEVVTNYPAYCPVPGR